MMYLSPIVRAVFISSLAALPSSLLILGYEGSVTDHIGWIGTAICILIIAIVGCTVFDLPIHFAMQKRNIKGRLVYGVAGFLTPVVIMASGPIIFLDWSELVNRTSIENTMVFSIAGTAVAVALREMMK